MRLSLEFSGGGSEVAQVFQCAQRSGRVRSPQHLGAHIVNRRST
jgi:hypothetical protein